MGIPQIALVMLAGGTEVAAWIEEDVYSRRLFTAACNPSAGSWPAAQLIDTDVAEFQLVTGSSGALLAWRASRSTFVSPPTFAVRAARFLGAAFEAPATLGSVTGDSVNIAAAADAAGFAVAVGLAGPGPAVVAFAHDGVGWSAAHTFGALSSYVSSAFGEVTEVATAMLASSLGEHCVVASIVSTGAPPRAIADSFLGGAWTGETDLFAGSPISVVKGLATDGARFAVVADGPSEPCRARLRAGGVWLPAQDVGQSWGVLTATGGAFILVSKSLANGGLVVATESGAGWTSSPTAPGTPGSAWEHAVVAARPSGTLVCWRAAVDTLAHRAGTLFGIVWQGTSFSVPFVIADGLPTISRVRAGPSATGFAVSWHADGSLLRREHVAGSLQPLVTVPLPHESALPGTLLERPDGFSALTIQRPLEEVASWAGSRGGSFLPTVRLSPAGPARSPMRRNTSPRIVVDAGGNVLVAWRRIDDEATGPRLVLRAASSTGWLSELSPADPLATGVDSLDTVSGTDGFAVAHSAGGDQVVLRRAADGYTANVIATASGAFHDVRAAAAGDNLAIAWLEETEFMRGGLWAVNPGSTTANRFLDRDLGTFRLALTPISQRIVANDGTTVLAYRGSPTTTAWSFAPIVDASTEPLLGCAVVESSYGTTGSGLTVWSRPGLVTAAVDYFGAFLGTQPPAPLRWVYPRTGTLTGDPVAALGTAGLAYGWIEDGQPLVVVRTYSSQAAEPPIALDPAPGSTRLLVAAVAGNGIDFAWTREDSSVTTTIVARRFQKDSALPGSVGQWLPPVTIATTPLHVAELVMAATPEGFTLAWEESGDIRAAIRVPRE